METFDSISKRASVREYKSKPISKGQLERLVDAGRRAPTARAVEPWEFVVVADKKTLQELGRITSPHGEFIGTASGCIAICCKDTKYYLEDGCAATENMLIAATALGIASCWVAGDKKPYCSDISNLLHVPSTFKLVSIISLGYPESGEAFKIKDKRPLNELLHWEKF